MSKTRYKTSKKQNKKTFKNVLPTPVLVIFAGVAVIAVALFAVWKARQPSSEPVPIQLQGTPRLQVDKDKIDLGDVPLGKTVSVSFLLTNVGEEALQFSKPPYIEVVEGC